MVDCCYLQLLDFLFSPFIQSSCDFTNTVNSKRKTTFRTFRFICNHFMVIKLISSTSGNIPFDYDILWMSWQNQTNIGVQMIIMSFMTWLYYGYPLWILMNYITYSEILMTWKFMQGNYILTLLDSCKYQQYTSRYAYQTILVCWLIQILAELLKIEAEIFSLPR